MFNQSGRYEEAMEHLQKSIEMFPDFPYMHSNFGGAYLAQSMYEKALREFQAQKDLSLGPIIDFQADLLNRKYICFNGRDE